MRHESLNIGNFPAAVEGILKLHDDNLYRPLHSLIVFGELDPISSSVESLNGKSYVSCFEIEG